jgi:hypothetical protein
MPNSSEKDAPGSACKVSASRLKDTSEEYRRDTVSSAPASGMAHLERRERGVGPTLHVMHSLFEGRKAGLDVGHKELLFDCL